MLYFIHYKFLIKYSIQSLYKIDTTMCVVHTERYIVTTASLITLTHNQIQGGVDSVCVQHALVKIMQYKLNQKTTLQQLRGEVLCLLSPVPSQVDYALNINGCNFIYFSNECEARVV